MPVDRQGKGKLSTFKVKSSILRHIVSISASVRSSPDISCIAVARPLDWEPACGTERSAASAKKMGVPPGNRPAVPRD